MTLFGWRPRAWHWPLIVTAALLVGSVVAIAALGWRLVGRAREL